MDPGIVRVDVGARSYDIIIGSGTLSDKASYRELKTSSRSVLVTNDTLSAIYGKPVRDVLEATGFAVDMIVLPDGEEHKVWSSVQLVLDAMLSSYCDRHSVVFALGGGVVGDTAGFAAACYMRGVRYVQLPTTLLAQVDSSVGGKTGINHVAGKNLIGAFHQPTRVVIDLDALDTLSNRHFAAGLAEVIKYGVACDEEFLTWIESNVDALLRREKRALLEAVKQSCRIKARVVAADEYESGSRAILNFGHTFAHAIEAGTGYGTWLHGEAVAAGMILAADLSVRLGMAAPSLLERILRLIRATGLPVQGPALGVASYLDLMQLDKKSQGGTLRFVLLQRVGQAVLTGAAAAAVAQTIEARTSDSLDRPTEN